MIPILILLISLSLDTFVMSFAYGANGLKISLSKQVIIALVSSSILIVSLFLGGMLQRIFPQNIALFICVAILFTLGSYQLIKTFLKTYLSRKPHTRNTFSFHWLGVYFNISLSIPSKTNTLSTPALLGVRDAFLLGSAISLDNIAAGFSFGLLYTAYSQVFLYAFFINLIMLALGSLSGYKLSQKIDLDLGWLSGLILILLAVTKLT